MLFHCHGSSILQNNMVSMISWPLFSPSPDSNMYTGRHAGLLWCTIPFIDDLISISFLKKWAGLCLSSFSLRSPIALVLFLLKVVLRYVLWYLPNHQPNTPVVVWNVQRGWMNPCILCKRVIQTVPHLKSFLKPSQVAAGRIHVCQLAVMWGAPFACSLTSGQWQRVLGDLWKTCQVLRILHIVHMHHQAILLLVLGFT